MAYHKYRSKSFEMVYKKEKKIVANNTQCGNFVIFLPLTFYVKLIFGNFKGSEFGELIWLKIDPI